MSVVINGETKLFVLVDDKRDPPAEDGPVIIRDPRVADAVLDLLHPLIHTLAMDNDMGHGWEFEGRNILKRFFDKVCKPTSVYPSFVMIMTNNSPAADDMAGTLKQHGYTREGIGQWVRL